MQVDEITRLTDTYFINIGFQNANISWRKKIYDDISELISKGFPLSIIENSIQKDPINFVKATAEYAKNNLIIEGSFYYHPYLQVAPSAPVIIINSDGTFSEIEDEFYLKLKSYFTFREALDYFYYRFNYLQEVTKRDLGAIEYVYKSAMIPWIKKNGQDNMNALDLLLFTIDAASFFAYDNDKKLTGVLELSDYAEDGAYIYKEKVNYAIINELNRTY